jgi:hypothetical protein
MLRGGDLSGQYAQTRDYKLLPLCRAVLIILDKLDEAAE